MQLFSILNEPRVQKCDRKIFHKLSKLVPLQSIGQKKYRLQTVQSQELKSGQSSWLIAAIIIIVIISIKSFLHSLFSYIFVNFIAPHHPLTHFSSPIPVYQKKPFIPMTLWVLQKYNFSDSLHSIFIEFRSIFRLSNFPRSWWTSRQKAVQLQNPFFIPIFTHTHTHTHNNFLSTSKSEDTFHQNCKPTLVISLSLITLIDCSTCIIIMINYFFFDCAALWQWNFWSHFWFFQFACTCARMNNGICGVCQLTFPLSVAIHTRRHTHTHENVSNDRVFFPNFAKTLVFVVGWLFFWL